MQKMINVNMDLQHIPHLSQCAKIAHLRIDMILQMGEISKIEQFVIDKVREIRMEAGVSQVKLSVDMELNAKFVGNVESSKTPDKYNLNHLNKIAEILYCSIKDFVPEQPFSGDISKKKSTGK